MTHKHTRTHTHTINDQLNGEIGVSERVDGTKPDGSHTELTGSPTYGDGIKNIRTQAVQIENQI